MSVLLWLMLLPLKLAADLHESHQLVSDVAPLNAV